MTQQALHTRIKGFSASLLCRSSQAVSGRMGTASGQTFRGLSRDFESEAEAGPNSFRAVPLTHSCIDLDVGFRWLSCWKLNLQSSLRSWELWPRVSSRYLCTQLLSSDFPVLSSLPLRAMLHWWDGIWQVQRIAWFPPDMTVSTEFRQNLRDLEVFSLRGGFILATPPQSPDCVWVLQSWLSLLELSSITTQDLWKSTRMTMWLLATSLTRALLPWFLSLVAAPSSGKSPGCSKYFPSKNYGDHCGSWEPAMQQKKL